MTDLFGSLAGLMGALGGWATRLPATADVPFELLAPAVAGAVAALLVAVAMTIYWRSGYRSSRDILRHGLATMVALGLIAFVISDMGHAALAHLGINPRIPAVEFEMRLPIVAARDPARDRFGAAPNHGFAIRIA